MPLDATKHMHALSSIIFVFVVLQSLILLCRLLKLFFGKRRILYIYTTKSYHQGIEDFILDAYL